MSRTLAYTTGGRRAYEGDRGHVQSFLTLESLDKSLNDSQLAIAIALPSSYRHIGTASQGPPEWSSAKLMTAVANEVLRRKSQTEREAEAAKAVEAAKAQQAPQAKSKKKSRKPVVKDGSKPYCQIHNVNSLSTQDCRSRA